MSENTNRRIGIVGIDDFKVHVHYVGAWSLRNGANGGLWDYAQVSSPFVRKARFQIRTVEFVDSIRRRMGCSMIQLGLLEKGVEVIEVPS